MCMRESVCVCWRECVCVCVYDGERDREREPGRVKYGGRLKETYRSYPASDSFRRIFGSSFSELTHVPFLSLSSSSPSCRNEADRHPSDADLGLV